MSLDTDTTFKTLNHTMLRLNKRIRDIEEQKKKTRREIEDMMDDAGVDKVKTQSFTSSIISPKDKQILDRELLIAAGVPIKVIDSCYKPQAVSPYLSVRRNK